LEERRPGHLGVTFLGTSSGQPTLTRGLSCVALVRDGDLFLFDCGEGAQIQFRKAGLRFGRLRAIFVTHMHGDHVTGLPGMLMSLQMTGREEPLPIVGPPGIGEFVRETARMIFTGFGFSLDFREHSEPGLVYEDDAVVVEAHPLEHRLFAIGYRFAERDFPGRFDVEAATALGVTPGPDFGRLQWGETVTTATGETVRPDQVLGPPRRGRVVSYCTDTRPCQGSVVLSREADFMIHEATFARDRLDDARETGHSTAEGAAAAALKAGARRLMITHFSPRYTEPDVLLSEARSIFLNTEAAAELREYVI